MSKTFNAEEALRLMWEENRLATFKKWVFADNEPCNALKLAEAGFYFIGNKTEPDSVKCFLCFKSLDGWEPDDCPWKEHLMHSPKCSFAKAGVSQGDINTEDFIELRIELLKKIYSNHMQESLTALKELKKLIK